MIKIFNNSKTVIQNSDNINIKPTRCFNLHIRLTPRKGLSQVIKVCFNRSTEMSNVKNMLLMRMGDFYGKTWLRLNKVMAIFSKT